MVPLSTKSIPVFKSGMFSSFDYQEKIWKQSIKKILSKQNLIVNR